MALGVAVAELLPSHGNRVKDKPKAVQKESDEKRITAEIK
jgi:hypothetical protein